MKRRTLDLFFASGGLVVAVILAALGYAVSTQAQFATDYAATELGAQKIVFTDAAKLTAEEKDWKAGSVCLTTFAGQTMTTGAQAECYAKFYIALHMENAAISAGFPGATYATLGTTRTDLSAQIAAAKAKGDTTGAADIQKKLDSATSLRTTMQTGETLRGLLLTVYGFSVIGEKAALAANLIYGLAVLMVVLSAAGFIHSFVTPQDEIVFGKSREWAKAPATV